MKKTIQEGEAWPEDGLGRGVVRVSSVLEWDSMDGQ